MTVRNLSVEPAVSASGELSTLLVEKMTNRIHEATLKQENLMSYFDVQDVTGTDRVSEKFMGDTELEVLAAGQAPNGSPVQFDKNSLVIDTVVIGRNYTRLLSDVQADVNGLHSKLADSQARKHKKMEDEMLLQQLMFSALVNNKKNRQKPRVSGMGFAQSSKIKESLLNDPNGLMAAIEGTLERMLDGRDGGDGVDLGMLTIFMPWASFNILRDAERICNSSYNTFQGTTVQGFTLKSYNIPIVPTNRMPRVAGRSMLSNEANKMRYDSTDEMTKCKALIFAPDALLVGRSINLEGDIWFDKDTKSWVIDSWQSEGAIPSVWDLVGMVYADATGNTTDADGLTNAEVVARANRKAISVNSTPLAASLAEAPARTRAKAE